MTNPPPLDRPQTPPGETGTAAWGDGSPPGVSEVRELFVVLGKALRAHQLYDEGNPVFQRFSSQLAQGFRALWRGLDALTVQVEEDRLLWEGEEVYRSASRSDSLAFLLFKDGIRQITFRQGVEVHELPALLKVLNRARDLRPEGDDLLTVLWETQLEYVSYEFVDLLAEGLDLPGPGGGSPEGLQRVLQGELGKEPEEEGEDEQGPPGAGAPPAGVVRPEDFNPTLYSLDPRELEALGEELRREMERDLRADVLAALFDRLEEPRFPGRQKEILEIFRALLPNLLSRGALAAASSILEELVRLLLAEGALRPEQRAQAEALLDEVSGNEAVRELLRALEDGTFRPDVGELAAFLRHLRAGALEGLLRGAEQAQDPGVKAVLQEAVVATARRHPQALMACLGSADPAVAAGACRLVGRLGVAEAVPRVAALLAQGPPSVRVAAVESLQALRTPQGAAALQQALEDPDREVRIAAARALGALGQRAAAPAFRRILEGKALRQADLSEQIAFFESYGQLRDPGGVRFLDGLLNGRGFLGRKEEPEIRACAALALGRMGLPEARQALQRAQGDPDAVVRSAVNRALRGEG